VLNRVLCNLRYLPARFLEGKVCFADDDRFPGAAAAAPGSDLLEVHITMSRSMFGPDVPA